MDPNNQNLPAPNTNPDLFPSPSFIPEPPIQAPKKSKKLVFIIVGAVIFLLLLIIVALAIPKKKSPPSNQSGNATAGQEAVLKQYLTDLTSGQYEQAYQLTNIKDLTQKSFVTAQAPYFVKTTDVAKCAVKQSTPPSNTSLLLYCPYKQGGGVLYEYQFENQNSQDRIVKIKLLREDKAK